MAIEELKEVKKELITPTEYKTVEYIAGYKCSNGVKFKTKEEAEEHEKKYLKFKSYFNDSNFKRKDSLLGLEEFHFGDNIEEIFWVKINTFDEFNALCEWYSYEFDPKLINQDWNLVYSYWYNNSMEDFWNVTSKKEIIEHLENIKKELPE